MTPVMLVRVIVHSIEVPRSTKVVTPVPGVVLTGTSFAGDRLATSDVVHGTCDVIVVTAHADDCNYDRSNNSSGDSYCLRM